MSVSVASIVLAGGLGSRVQRDINKVYISIGDRPILEYSLETMDRSPRIGQVVLVVRDEDRARAELIINETIPSKLAAVVAGGPSRHLSEMAGLNALRPRIERGDFDLVAIHDGARPFMTLELLDDLIDAAMEHEGAIPGLPIAEPLYRRREAGVELMHPEKMRRVQTPQVFRAQPLLAAYDASIAPGFEGVDTAETIERFSSLDVVVVPGDPRNIKVTFIEDIYEAEEYAMEWDKGTWVGS